MAAERPGPPFAGGCQCGAVRYRFAAAPASTTSEGPAAGGTALSLSGQNFAALSQLHIGTQFVPNPSDTDTTLLQATTPPNAAPGAANH